MIVYGGLCLEMGIKIATKNLYSHRERERERERASVYKKGKRVVERNNKKKMWKLII